MRSLRFYASSTTKDGTEFSAGSGNSRDNPRILHIETDGCIVNIQVGLTDATGRPVTRVDVSADGHGRGGDGQGRIWQAFNGQSQIPEDGAVVRVIMTEGRNDHDQEAGR